MGIIPISGGRHRRAWIVKMADWIAVSVPWTVDASHWPAFETRWPGLTPSDLKEIDAELQRRGETICASDDFEAVAATLSGRSEYWSAAAAWLRCRFPEADIYHPQLTREECFSPRSSTAGY